MNVVKKLSFFIAKDVNYVKNPHIPKNPYFCAKIQCEKKLSFLIAKNVNVNYVKNVNLIEKSSFFYCGKCEFLKFTVLKIKIVKKFEEKEREKCEFCLKLGFEKM